MLEDATRQRDLFEERSEWPSVTLCIPTYKRPVGLGNLLDHIEKLTYRGPLKLIVVDNDADEQAGVALVDRRKNHYRFPIRGVLEAQRGQTFAYNRAFNLAATEQDASDLAAVLDDDEYPAADWLTLMVSAMRTYDVGVVGGPVLPVFEEPGHWMAKTDLFVPLRFPTGRVPAIYGAGSMLIRRDILLQYLDEPFSNELAFTGGSDIDFFHRCRRDGVRFAWADDAIVSETIPASRMSVSWLLRRSFRAGTDLGRVARKYDPGFRSMFLRLAKGPGLIGISMARLPLRALAGRAQAVRTLMDAARGIGRIAAEFDLKYEEYRKTHGA